MILTLDIVEKILVEHEIASQEEIDKCKENRTYGSKSCKILRRFRDEVKVNFSLFFPRKPKMQTLHRSSERLFKKGKSNFDQESPGVGLECLEEEGLDSDEELPMSRVIETAEMAIQTAPGK